MYSLLLFFEKKVEELDNAEVQLIENQRKSLGGRFPEIPVLFDKITHFFSMTQEYLLEYLKSL